MMRRTSWMGALAALGVTLCANVAYASSHREAPSISDDPAADNTDLYAWVQGTNLVVVANYIGLELPEGGPNWAKFSDDVLYEVHLARGGTSLDDALTYQIQFKTAAPKYADPGAMPPITLPNTGGLEFFGQLTGSGAFNQTYTVTKLTNGSTPTVVATDVPVPPPNVGAKTNAVAYQIPSGQTYEQFFIDSGKDIGALQGGGKVFAGPRDDPFFVDLGGVFDLAQIRPVANPGQPKHDSLSYMNVHSIVLQIPLTEANGGTAPVAGAHAAQTVGVWASASRRKVTVLRRSNDDAHFGPYVQVSRLGLPLVNEAIIGLQDKDYWNRLTPKDDLATFGAYILNPIAVRDADAIGFYGAGGPLAGCKTAGGHGPQTNRMDIVGVINLPDHSGAEAIATVGDVLRVDLGQASGFPNGRLLTDDVVDVELQMLLCTLSAGGPIPDGPTSNEPEAPLPKKSGGAAVFPYLQPPWEGRASTPRTVPVATP